jgi:predicted MPP superfamily phosphohydrolase
MTLFLVMFLLIYGSAHVWFLLRLGLAWPDLQQWWLLPVCWCLLMVAAPLLVRLLEQKGQSTLALPVAYIGYSWMGLLFVFVSISLVLELARLLHWSARFFLNIPAFSLLEPRPFFLFCLGLSALITCYGWFEAAHLKTDYHALRSSKLPKGASRIRIVQISDLHVGLIVGVDQVQKLVAAVKREKPDLVVATGDTVDGLVSHSHEVAALLHELSAPMGRFAVFGNHEYYAGIGQSRRFLEQSGFKVLQNKTELAGNYLALVGLDDPAARRPVQSQVLEEATLLGSVPKERFVLLLKHRPEIGAESGGLFDLQLSGHVHKGQIFPFNLLTWLRFPVRAGMNDLTGGRWLYVSRGTGTWGPPIRFLAPPELTVIDLMPVEN